MKTPSDANAPHRVRKSKAELVEELLKKTVKNGCTEGEENAAVTKAHDLCVKHGIDESRFTWPDVEEPTRTDAAHDESAAEEPVVDTKDEAKENRRDRGEIGKFCKEQLMATVRVDEAGLKIGLPYNDVLAKVRERFPSAGTTYNCLRWYAANLRKGNHDVPLRPEPVRMGTSRKRSTTTEQAEAAAGA